MQRPAAAAAASAGPAGVSPQQPRSSKMIRVYDCRTENGETPKIDLDARCLDFNGFMQLICKKFALRFYETFVLVTTDRKVMNYDTFGELQSGSTLYLLHHENQPLPAAMSEEIMFQPHYDSLLKAGTFEYYAEGQKSFTYALAELVDNSLSATSGNSGVKTIEIRMLFDKTPAVLVLDNGRGMSSKDLNNWATYRLSKFKRNSSIFSSEKEDYVRPDHTRRSLNSDISYFGVGGKQASFFIGDSVRMISKQANSPDVHELVLSKEDFERKEENKEDIYKGTILNRKAGDSSHIADDERFLHSIIAEESGKDSFTAAVITGVFPDHITYLKQHFDEWTRKLAHVYHYYIHGVDGNNMRSPQTSHNHLNIDILVTLREKPPKCPRVMNLREVEDDMQTLYINAAVDTFEFKAQTGDGGVVEGVLRYHPFLYDKETYPKDPVEPPAPVDEEDDDYSIPSGNLGTRDIFECFWNGRLIPYTKVSEFDWCPRSCKGTKLLPSECYSRFSGVLFTDDKFLVSSSKLKFMELELKLKDKETIFTPNSNTQRHSQRGNIEKEFKQWLQNCHEKYDKEVEFLGYKETITREDAPNKKMQFPWATFSTIEWDGKTYKEGQLVKSQKTVPIIYGSVIRFLLYGEYNKTCFATGGHVEVNREPEALYHTTKIIPISKIDKTATDENIRTYIENDVDKIPEKLVMDWPEGNPWSQDSAHPAGTPLGPLRVNILNRKGDPLSVIQTGGPGKKMNVDLKIVHHGSKGDKQIGGNTIARFVQKHGYWFKKIENLTSLGKYTLSLKSMINDPSDFGGRLPKHELKFTIKEGEAESFTVGEVNPTLRVGVPFNIPLQIVDRYNHPVTLPSKIKPVIDCGGLDLSYETVSSSSSKTFTISGVKARGKVLNYQKSYDLTVTLPGLKTDTKMIKIALLPGNPHSLHVKPELDQFKLENGDSATFTVEVLDEAGNITANPKQIVRCQVSGLPPVTTDCSRTGSGQLVTKPINVHIIDGQPQMLGVQFNMPSQRHIKPVMAQIKVLPSSRVSKIQLYFQDGDNLMLRNNEKIDWQAGGVLERLFYKLYDESEIEVPLTAEIASKIKVNWTADVDQADLFRGKLPDVQVPTQVQELRFHQVSYQDQNVSFSFTIIPCPDKPERLRATLPENTVKLGETLPGDIKLELVDQYDNVTNSLTHACLKYMTVDAEGLNKSEIAFQFEENCSYVAVAGVSFHSGSLGPRELCFTFNDYVASAIVKVTAGVPAQLQLLSGPEQPLQVLNGNSISTPFLIQLCDQWGNPCPDQGVVVQIESSSPSLELSTVTLQPVDADGKVSFTVDGVNGPKGCYQLLFKSSFNGKAISGPSVNLTVIPDPNKPVKLSVKYDTRARFCAGGTFPVFSVTVVSDEGSPITSCNPADLSMLLWEGESSMPPQTAINLKCSKPMGNDRNDCFYFRDKDIPESTGTNNIQFSLFCSKTRTLFSDQIKIDVVANQPVKLGPDSQPNTPVVFYSTDMTNRRLVENLTLKIKDKCGNAAGQKLNGKVIVSIRCCDKERNQTLPLFEGQKQSVEVGLQRGAAHILNLSIMKNSPGDNGSTYILVFKPEVQMIPTALAAFELPFKYYNDAESQGKMSELTRKKDQLTAAIAKNEEINTSFRELREALTNQLLNACKKEEFFRNELNKRNMRLVQHSSIADIDQLLTEKTAEAERNQNVPRRICSIHRNNFSGPDVLGMVGHLAFIQDDDAARVISWHLTGDMNCVVTKTTAAANRIYHDTQGAQQVMPLDGIHVQAGDRPLPHMRNGRKLFEPPGNPVHARNLLMFPTEKEKCDVVFKNLLADTIVMDDLESATNYRRMVVQNKMPCPTILTRQGDRVSARGKFGGSQNKAPPLHKLVVFGAPLPPFYAILKEEIELLCQYRTAVEKKKKVEKERDNHIQTWRSPEKQQKMEEMEKQLREIEEELTSERPRKRSPGADGDGETSGILTKRLRQRSK
ncbi:structural maintenance of chromosomes flexible hinge domain-containing protein 1 [Cololabis saira]|uniref:structural maintenance of chromosomes flexible hinge domain-containing protein 1 n=1 Tax=Cololabis saira TaxID=129043 RepID=UPI002AD482A6|nr:structural maintenance of chromosomes flexible hinge domain-containing protein 1 [Cololabis saira]